LQVPSGTEAARAFIPAREFDSSKAFYEALGFKKLLDGDVAIFGVGASAFILQRYYKKEWAENCMMQMMVDNLDAWWEHIEALDLPNVFGVQPPNAPAMQPWGLRVAYVWDPLGCFGMSPSAARMRQPTSRWIAQSIADSEDLRFADDLSVGRSREQDEITVWVLDNEIPCAPGLLLERLMELHPSGLKVEEQLLDLGDGFDLDRG
jgi:hypothetical protein